MRIILFCTLTIALFSCSKKDKELPVLSLQNPTDSLVVKAGEAFTFKATISDNEMLSQYKIDIHNNFDGHSHQKVDISPWEKIIINDITGINSNPEINIDVPEYAAAGFYHMVVTAVDASGNLSEFVLRNLKIINPADTIAPVLVTTSPNDNQQFALNSTITVSGSATDDIGLKSVKITINPLGSNNTLYTETKTLSGVSESWSTDVSLAGISWAAGSYQIRLLLLDNYYNTAKATINFVIN